MTINFSCELLLVENRYVLSVRALALIRGTQREKIGKTLRMQFSAFFISFYGLLKGYLCELTLFDLFACGS